MYTVSVLDYVRPIFIVFTIILLILLIFVGFQKTHIVNKFSVVSIPLICVVISAMVLFLEGVIVDEMNLGGDPVTSILFLVIIALSFINYAVYSFRNRVATIKHESSY